ncbi:MAG: hypothetical protein ABIQ41_09030 [Gemmatimonadales bacterium]
MKKKKKQHFPVEGKPPTVREEMEGIMHAATGMTPFGAGTKPMKGTEIMSKRSPGKQERIKNPKGKKK